MVKPRIQERRQPGAGRLPARVLTGRKPAGEDRVTQRREPGSVRDAILAYMTHERRPVSIAQICAAANASLGEGVAPSSVRSYMTENVPCQLCLAEQLVDFTRAGQPAGEQAAEDADSDLRVINLGGIKLLYQDHLTQRPPHQNLGLL